MSYPWNNEPRFNELKMSGEGDILVYKAGTEKASVYIVDNDIEKIVCTYDGKEQVITKKQRRYISVGEGSVRRDVFHYVVPKGPLPSLRVGITRHVATSTWSSLPHAFELHAEPGFEEVFFYLLEGGPQRAIQVGRGVWFDNSPVDEVWPVKHRSWSTIPMGYHPVVGEPGVIVSYIWAYIAKKAEWEKV